MQSSQNRHDDFTEGILLSKSKLMARAMNLTKDYDKAEELVSETIYKAYLKKHTYRNKGKITPWLLTILYRLFVNNYRRKKKSPFVSDNTDEQYLINNYDLSIENHEKAIFKGNDLEIAFEKVDKSRFKKGRRYDYTVPFVMYQSGYAYNEIAAKLSVPLGTIKSQIHISKDMLRKELSDYVQ